MHEIKLDIADFLNRVNEKFNGHVVDHRILLDEKAVPSNDIDIILIIKKEADPYAIVNAASQLLVPLIKKHGMLISCFPIKESVFNDESTASQFILNIKSDGQKIKI